MYITITYKTEIPNDKLIDGKFIEIHHLRIELSRTPYFFPISTKVIVRIIDFSSSLEGLSTFLVNNA